MEPTDDDREAARAEVERRMNDRLLRMPEVEQRVGLSNSTIYLKIAQGTFPKPIKVGSAAVRWRESEVNQWIADCITASVQDKSETAKEQTPKPSKRRSAHDQRLERSTTRPASSGSFFACVIRVHSHS